MSATLNGKPPRKQLGDQLDRLDGIIDCLADRLPEAVTDACREGARQAVKDAVLEILTNPDLRALIADAARPAPQSPADPAPPARPSAWARAKAKFAATRDAATTKLKAATFAAASQTAAAAGVVAARCSIVKTSVAGAARLLSAVMPVKQVLLVGAAVGALVGAAAYLCPHGVSAAAAGAGGMCAAVAVQAAAWARRAARSFGIGVTG